MSLDFINLHQGLQQTVRSLGLGAACNCFLKGPLVVPVVRGSYTVFFQLQVICPNRSHVNLGADWLRHVGMSIINGQLCVPMSDAYPTTVIWAAGHSSHGEFHVPFRGSLFISYRWADSGVYSASFAILPTS